MNILISNDDGWGSPGIRTLEKVARRLGNVWVAAPADPMSGISHQMTFEVPMTFEEREPQSFSLTGTPADCTRVAMSQLGVDFDWVLSGVNQGANLGADMAISGTIAAVREAAFFGCRGIAFSQYLEGMRSPFEWNLTEELLDRLLPQLLDDRIAPGQWANVNFPDSLGQPVGDIEFVKTVPDRNPLPSKYMQVDENKIIYCGKYKDRDCDAGSDADVCFGGSVSITHHQGGDSASGLS
jgi:5'-nucleotidase